MAWYDDILNTVTSSPSTPGLLTAGINAIGAGFASNQSQQTQQNIAAGTQETARAAAEAAAFRPVGVTSRFGSSGFQYYPQGRLIGAGYQVAPDIAAQREALLGMSGNALTQAQQAQMATAPAQRAAQGLFGLGNQFLPTSAGYSAAPEAGQLSNFLRQQAAQAAPGGFSASPTASSQAYSNQLSGIAGAALPASFAGRASAEAQAYNNQFSGAGGSLMSAPIQGGASAAAQAFNNRLSGIGGAALPSSLEGSATPEARAYYNQLSNTANQVMPTSYDTTAAAQRYMQQQQSLLAPQREQQLASIRNQLQQTGRSGLATGATSAGGLAATNPEMAAYYNSIAQQDAQLGANAQQQARSNLQSDIGLASQLGGAGLNAFTSSQQQASQNALARSQYGSGLLGQGYSAANASDQQNFANSFQQNQYGSNLVSQGYNAANASGQQGLSNALQQGQFASNLIGQGYGATNAAGQQNLSNSLNLGQFAAGQLGTALQTQTSADEIARQRMLSNISTGTGLYNSGLGLMNAGYGSQQAALSPYTSYLGGATSLEALGQNALTTGTGLGSSQAAAGAQQGSLMNAGRLESNYALQNAAKTQANTSANAVTGGTKQINQLINGLFNTGYNPAARPFGITGNSSFGEGDY
jgi:hypothetical protein